MLKKMLKYFITGVSWRNPLVNLLLHALNPIDHFVLVVRGLSHLPPYSIRVRSNGVSKQFGGEKFFLFGHQLAKYLKTYANLSSESKVLEIGCGCGRTAFALSEILNDGNYYGIDIEPISLESCLKNSFLASKNFHFQYMDVHNNEYNPNGKSSAGLYCFPFKNNEFDVVFLVSVFTHMLTDEVKNYITEISRMLRPGGICMITTFLMDKGRKCEKFSFPLNEKEHYFYNQTMPEVAVGYFSGFYISQFDRNGLRKKCDILWGSWRNTDSVISSSDFSQDIIFFEKDI